ncbi:MAG: nuclear transport factor 2 family protein [Lewinellaceae bacterium]|nr:nuclear transport factor 2 family protein [Lewinellaceae bacterium]
MHSGRDSLHFFTIKNRLKFHPNLNAKLMKVYSTLFLSLFFLSSLSAQVEENTELFQTLRAKDSLLFNVGFNTCDISQFKALVSEDMEFYHDQSGITGSKADFIAGMENGLCKMEYKARRELVEGSLRVFPMNNNGNLYGAIQTGEHRFYAKYPEKEEVLTSTAIFTHLWLLEEGEWRLSRVLSYDHKGN